MAEKRICWRQSEVVSRPLSPPPVWRELTGRHWTEPGFVGSIRAVLQNRGETVFIHLGGNKMIRISEVITILDAGNRRSPCHPASFFG